MKTNLLFLSIIFIIFLKRFDFLKIIILLILYNFINALSELKII